MSVATAHPAQQQTSDEANEQEQNPPVSKPDIVVVGTKNERPKTIALQPIDRQGRARHAARAERFAKCMQFLDLDLLHRVVDGPPEYSSTRFALGRLIQKNLGCYPDLEKVPRPGAIDLGTCDAASVGTHKECRAPYDRAAILRRAIRKYAPDLSLTVEQVNDPAVQARLDAREVPLNRYRRGDDKLLFEISICMVRLRPEQAVQLTMTDDRLAQNSLTDAVISGANECIGGAKQLDVGQDMFRAYISDAVYRWVVATRNVDSLLPKAE